MGVIIIPDSPVTYLPRHTLELLGLTVYRKRHAFFQNQAPRSGATTYCLKLWNKNLCIALALQRISCDTLFC
jgi:hypothetical protein